MNIRLKLVTILVLLGTVPAFGMFSKVRSGFSTLAGRIKTGMQSAWARPTIRYGTGATLAGATVYGAQQALKSAQIPTPTDFNKATIWVAGSAKGDYDQFHTYLSPTSKKSNSRVDRFLAKIDCNDKNCTFSVRAKEQWIQPNADDKQKIIFLHKNRAQFEKCMVNPHLSGCSKLFNAVQRKGQLPLPFDTFKLDITFDDKQEKREPAISRYNFPFFFV